MKLVVLGAVPEWGGWEGRVRCVVVCVCHIILGIFASCDSSRSHPCSHTHTCTLPKPDLAFKLLVLIQLTFELYSSISVLHLQQWMMHNDELLKSTCAQSVLLYTDVVMFCKMLWCFLKSREMFSRVVRRCVLLSLAFCVTVCLWIVFCQMLGFWIAVYCEMLSHFGKGTLQKVGNFVPC